MKVLCVAVGKRGGRALAVAAGIGAMMPSLRAELVFTEKVSVNEVNQSAETSAVGPGSSAPKPVIGDELTIRYRVSQPSDSPSSDADSVVYDHVNVAVTLRDQTIYSTDAAELTVWNLIGFYGVTITDFSGPLLDYLASSSSDVISKGFLTPNVPISKFDSADGGSVFTGNEVIGFLTDSYQFSGEIPLTAVPEPATYGMAAAIALLGLVSVKRLRGSR